MRRFLTPAWLLSHAFVLAMVVVMVSLGMWQLRRLDERRDRNDEVRAAFEAEPLAFERLVGSGRPPPDHTATVVTGRYLDASSFLVANRTFDSQPGSWLVTPMELSDGSVVAISRGWVSRLWAAGEDERDLTAPAGEVEVLGRVFESVGGGRIGTSDVAVLRELSRMDLDRVRELTGLEIVDTWVQLERQVPPLGDLPVPVPRASLDEGPHLSYAFQWFFFSTGAVVVYGLILRRRREDPDEEDDPVAG